MSRDSSIKRIVGAVIAGCAILILGTTGFGVARAYSVKKTGVYATGQIVDLPSNIYDGAERTLVLVLRADCFASQQAAPEYARLIDRLKSSASEVRTVVVTSTQHPEAEKLFAARLGASRHEMLATDSLRLRSVPTVLLVDNRGTVLFAEEAKPANADGLMGVITQRIPGR